MRTVFTLLFLCCVGLGVAQLQQKRNPFFSIRGNIGIPKPLGSQMFRTAFNGVYEGNLSLNLRLFSNFYAGAGYQNTNLQNNKEVFAYYTVPGGGASLSYNTRLIGHGGFIKLGLDQFVSEQGYISYSINTGMLFCEYMNVERDSSAANRPFVDTKFSSLFVQPEVSGNFKVNPNLAFSIMLSYTTVLDKFNPKAPRFNQFGEINSKRNTAFMSWINIGFGFSVLLD